MDLLIEHRDRRQLDASATKRIRRSPAKAVTALLACGVLVIVLMPDYLFSHLSWHTVDGL